MTESTNLIYTPREKIPLGEALILPNGVHGLKVKWRRGKRDVTEVVPLDKLHELVMQGNIKTREQGSL